MRGMLYAYSALFFRQITVWAIVSIGLVALSAISTPVVVALDRKSTRLNSSHRT